MPILSVIIFSFLISMILSIGLSIYAFRIPKNKAAITFGYLMLIITLWIFIKLISLFVFSVEIREMIHKINILVVILVSPFLLLVAVYHSNFPKHFSKKHIISLFTIPFFIYLLVFISGYSNFLFYNFRVQVYNGIPIHSFKLKLWYHLMNIYDYILIFITFAILFKSLFNKNRYFRKQIILFIIGVFIPVINDILYINGLSIIKDYNLAPVFLSVGNLFLAWSMFGYRFFKVLPVARNLIIENMPDVMIITNSDNHVIDFNQSGENLFEYKKDKIIGISFLEVFSTHPEFIEIYNNNKPLKTTIIRKGNQILHFSVSISTFGDSEKPGFSKIIILHDITEQIKADAQIKRLSIAIEQSPVTIAITDVKGNIEYVNPAFSKITGYSADEAMGVNPRILKGNTPPETFVNLWETVLSGKVWKGEFINRKKSGEYYYEEATISPIKNDNNEIVNFIAIKSDISERKKSEEKLRQSEENLKSAQSIGNIGHWEYNNSNGDLFWSEQMYRIYDVSYSEFKPTYEKVVEFFHPEDRQRIEDEFSFSIRNKSNFEIQHRIITTLGKTKFVIERSSTKYDIEGNPLITIGSVADITPLKLVEEELNNERALLRSLIDSIPDFIFVKDINGAFQLLNASLVNFYGISSHYVLGKTDYDIYDPILADFFTQKDKEIIEIGKTQTNEEQVSYKDGTLVWLETTKTPFLGADGKIKGVIGISRDISQRRKNEEELRENRANLLSLVENTSDNIWAIDNSYCVVFANLQFKNAFAASFGVEIETGTNIIKALPSDLKELWKSRYNRALANERFIFEDHFVFSDIHFYVEVAMNPIIAGNKVIGVSVFSRNITERKTAENLLKHKNDEIASQNEEYQQLNEELQTTNQALHLAKAQAEESEELFKQLMNFSPVYIYIKDVNLQNMRMSDNFKELIDIPVHKTIGKTDDKIWPAEYAQKLLADDKLVLLKGNPIETENKYKGRYFTSIKFPIILEGKIRYLAGFSIDITDRKNAQDKIAVQNEELKELNVTKDRFFSIIAHDLRSPFNTIIGFSDYLVNNLESCKPEEIKLFANNINISANQTYKLLENLLDWSRLQRGMVKADLQNQNIKLIADEIELFFNKSASNKSIIIKNNIKNDIIANCDLQMTKTIMRNLVSNAIKFTNENKTVKIEAFEKEQIVEIQIIDNGVGIHADKLHFLFSIEKNSSTPGTANEAGTGLGLLLCKELVENQGGKIWVESEEGKGSIFHFSLNKLNL